MLPSLLTFKFYKNIRKNITHNVANFLFCTYPTNTMGQQTLQVVCFVSLVKSWTTRAQFRRPPDSQLKPKTVCHTLLTTSCTHNNRCQPRTWYEYVYVLPRNRAAHGDCVRMIRAPAIRGGLYKPPGAGWSLSEIAFSFLFVLIHWFGSWKIWLSSFFSGWMVMRGRFINL